MPATRRVALLCLCCMLGAAPGTASAGDAPPASDAPAPLAGVWRGYLNSGMFTWHYRIELKKAGNRYAGQAMGWKLCTEAIARAVAAGSARRAPDSGAVFMESVKAVLKDGRLMLVGDAIKGVPNAGLKPDVFELELPAPGVATAMAPQPKGDGKTLIAFCTEAIWNAPSDPVAQTGTVLRRECLGLPFHYTLYLPKAYVPGKPMPLCVHSNPGGNAGPLSTAIAEECGVIMVGLTEAKNGPWTPVVQNRDAVLFDLRRIVSVDWTRVIFGGESGGARASRISAACHPDLAAGLFLATAADASVPEIAWPDPGIPIFFLTGATDMNNGEVQAAFNAQRAAKRPCEILIHDGGHTTGGRENVDKALRWLVERLPRPAPPKPAGKAR